MLIGGRRPMLNADGHSGTFDTADGKASGRFDCGAVPKKQSD